ncbi:MAG: isoaspartyl peptidase/L-asparaginase [Aureispira sp.]|nr:isoaspartyl peptidase/L-asparaginase [Aureispira sp.]
MKTQNTIAIHGGAGTILRSKLTPEKEKAYRKALHNTIVEGAKILKKGGTAIDAVTEAVHCMEDIELFNAGKGSVFTAKGIHEMDASIMCGKSLNTGAVAGISTISNPIELAKIVMEKSQHMFFVGAGAIAFAKEHGIKEIDPNYFFNQHRFDQWKRVAGSKTAQLDHSDRVDEDKSGTVGAVAIDQYGNLAAATSTGGMTNKQQGRVGDSPIIGAGTYANNNTCAVSCTGHGEYFMRTVLAHRVSCLMELCQLSLEEACQRAIYEDLQSLGGSGGLIAVDTTGKVSFVFNSEGMYRAVKIGEQAIQTGIWRTMT